MADITNVFKATVKTIRVRQKNCGADTGVDKNILPACRKARSEFTSDAMEVVSKADAIHTASFARSRVYSQTR